MAQQYPPNVMEPYTRTASDTVRAASAARGVNEVKLRRKYKQTGGGKSSRPKAGGNSGKVGHKFRSEQRMHGTGRPSLEQKLRSEAQSKAFQEWRASWMSGTILPQPG